MQIYLKIDTRKFNSKIRYIPLNENTCFTSKTNESVIWSFNNEQDVFALCDSKYGHEAYNSLIEKILVEWDKRLKNPNLGFIIDLQDLI